MLKLLSLNQLFRSAGVLACLAAAGTAFGQGPTETNITVTESDVPNTECVVDPAPSSGYGSLAADGSGKSEVYFSPGDLFGGPVTLGDIKSISYYTKNGQTHTADPRDWYLNIYTMPYVGDASSSWYGTRIGAEPYFAIDLTETPGEWTQWSTDAGDNQLRFFESTAGAPGATFGSYTDPDFATFIAQNTLGTSNTYAAQEVILFSIQTGSGWANGFTGQVDALRIELTDGSAATIDFECDDTDGDGVDDIDDDCPLSVIGGFVDVGSGPTSIANNGVDENGCSIQDLVNECAANASNHGQYVSCIVQLANQLPITKAQQKEMKTGAAKSNVGK